MPELPEVETIINGLRPKIVGKQITQADILNPQTVWLDTIPATGDRDISLVYSFLKGKHIRDITRRGKVIIVELTEEAVLLLHLKMTGQLIFISHANDRYVGGHPSPDFAKELPVKSTRVIFHLDDGSTLYFNDQRKFGYLKVMTYSQYQAYLDGLKFGPDALSEMFSGEYLYRVCQQRTKITIKQLLLDQHVVAGIGNIYADESLFNAKIHPAISASQLTSSSADRLVSEIKNVLKFSIMHNGTSSEHYVTSTGEQGDMQNFLQVYRKDGQPCPRCGSALHRIVIGGRGTHFCQKCQKK